MSDDVCKKCGQIHTRCTAHTRAGRPCRTPPMEGSNVCRMHGGAASQARAIAARRREQQAAQQAVKTLGLPVNVSPTQALLDEVHWTAGHVQWLRAKVQDLEHHELEWGKTREKTGGDDHGTTYEAAPSIWYDLYERERKHLVTVCAAALKAGIEERAVRLAEQQGALVSEALTRILDALLETMTGAGLTTDQQAIWAETVPVVVPRELRRLAAGN